MADRIIKDIPKSVSARLLNIAKARKEDFNQILNDYAMERLLYRLSISQYKDNFVVKGAKLFQLWTNTPHRPTHDLDLLSFGNNEIDHVVNTFHKVLSIECQDDGLKFVLDNIKGERIKADQKYQGVRITAKAFLDSANIHLQIDVGFGDIITPGVQELDYPTLLTLPSPRLLVYPKETVVAEKFHAMVLLGMTNTRIKDFYDLWVLATTQDFQGHILLTAIQRTFEKRASVKLTPETPIALTEEFYNDVGKKAQWSSFLKRTKVTSNTSLAESITKLHNFLMPVSDALLRQQPFDFIWYPQQGWNSK